METKICSKCKIEKSVLEFNKCRKNKDGLHYTCKFCRKQSRENNKEELNIKAKNYYENNKEERLIYQKQYRQDNKEKIAIRMKRYQQNNKEELTIYQKQYQQDNKEEIAINTKKYREDNKKEIASCKKEYVKEKRKNDPCFKLRANISRTINRALKSDGSSKNGQSCRQYLPSTIKEIKDHLESLFEPWMNWNNWGIYNSETWNDNDDTTWTWNLDHRIPQSDLPYSEMTDENFKKTWELSNIRPYSAKQNVIDGSTRVRHKKK